ncbi:MAG: hypothetical protein ABI051_06170 [Vicinamibacterales bacterium]
MDSLPLPAVSGDLDVGDFCRRVEEHLARVNKGHLVRIVGTGFELVRGWAAGGIPLSVVCRAIDQKAERHQAGRSRRPLRIEFCEDDVQGLYQDWRRAVGVADYGEDPAPDAHPAREERRRPSLARQIDRAMERLVRAAGHLDLPGPFRDALTGTIEQLVVLRDEAAHARGDARQQLAAKLADLDRQLLVSARTTSGVDIVLLESEAALELSAYRERLTGDAWQVSLDAAVDRLLRGHLGLPTLDPDAA